MVKLTIFLFQLLIIAQHVFSCWRHDPGILGPLPRIKEPKYYKPDNYLKDLERTLEDAEKNSKKMVEILEKEEALTKTMLTAQQEHMKNQTECDQTSEDKITNCKQKLDETQSVLTKRAEETAVLIKERNELLYYPRTKFQQEHAKFEEEIQICITGHSRSGKSTFINTLRNIESKKKMKTNGQDVSLFAEVKHGEEGTMFATPYKPVEKNDKVLFDTFWDLPGYGTTNFPNKTYLKDMGLRYFDLVILMISDGFGEHDITTIFELFEHKIPFVVVFNKFDKILKYDLGVEVDESLGKKSPSPLIRQIKEYKDNGRPLDDFLIQVQTTYDNTHQRMTNSLKSKYIDNAFFISSLYADQNIYDMPQLIEKMQTKIDENNQKKHDDLELLKKQNQSTIDALKIKMDETNSIITN